MLTLFERSDVVESPDFQQQAESLHPLCILASKQLQSHLAKGIPGHSFGLAEETGPVIGKMFGVLIVEIASGQLGYLCGFSGKLAGTNQHAGFVPPVFDMLTENSFLNIGMAELNSLNQEIRDSLTKSSIETQEIKALKSRRRSLSRSLQHQLFENYIFINRHGEERSLNKIFADASYKNPPAGAGECAAPKLLQHAFRNNMKPIALAEFWWGQSPKSETWKHGEFYPSCKEKCGPILGFMFGSSG